MSTLAIKGHPTRGSEVIALLKMLGGKILRDRFAGNEPFCWYYINGNGYIDYKHYSLFDSTMVFTLEEFLEKFPYKVGDKVIFTKYGDKDIVTIQSMMWTGTTIEYTYNDYCTCLTKDLQPYKEQETMEESKELLIGFTKDDEGNWILNTHKDYEIEAVNGKFKLIKKKPKYPKTYVDCCDVLGYKNRNNTIQDFFNSCDLYDFELMTRLSMLKLCRDAYWKIAGEEMGLGKPWNQDYHDRCFIIANNKGDIYTYEYHGSNNVILSFPTEEMRDTFYENFKNLIEQCKKLL